MYTVQICTFQFEYLHQHWLKQYMKTLYIRLVQYTAHCICKGLGIVCTTIRKTYTADNRFPFGCISCHFWFICPMPIVILTESGTSARQTIGILSLTCIQIWQTRYFEIGLYKQHRTMYINTVKSTLKKVQHFILA